MGRGFEKAVGLRQLDKALGKPSALNSDDDEKRAKAEKRFFGIKRNTTVASYSQKGDDGNVKVSVQPGGFRVQGQINL